MVCNLIKDHFFNKTKTEAFFGELWAGFSILSKTSQKQNFRELISFRGIGAIKGLKNFQDWTQFGSNFGGKYSMLLKYDDDDNDELFL